MTYGEMIKDEESRKKLREYAEQHGMKYHEVKRCVKHPTPGSIACYEDAYLLTGIHPYDNTTRQYVIAWKPWLDDNYMLGLSWEQDIERLLAGLTPSIEVDVLCKESDQYIGRNVYPTHDKSVVELVDGIRKGLLQYADYKKQIDAKNDRLNELGTYTADIKSHIEELGVYQVTMSKEQINPKDTMCYYYEFEVTKKADSSYMCKFSLLHNEERDTFWMYNYPTFAGIPLGKKYKLVTNGKFSKKVIGSFGSCLGAIDQLLEIQSILDSAWNQIQEVKKNARLCDEYQMSDMECLGQDREELPKVVQVHWKDGHFNTERDFRIKFISTTGVGCADRTMGVEYAGRAMVTRWFAFRYGSECTMPDGTKFVLESDNGKYLTDGDRIRFKTQIVDWVNGRRDRCYK